MLSGEYTVGIEGEEYVVEAGDSLHILSERFTGTATTATRGAFLCAVPTGDDEIRLVDR